MTLHTDGIWFKDDTGRTRLLHGVNLGGSSKMPTRPNGQTHLPHGFFDHRDVSFVGRPFPLDEADQHFARLKTWGLTFIRFLVTWEAIEHAAPGVYDTEYLDYVQAIVAKARGYGMIVFIDPHQDVWSRFTGGDGAPGWTLEAVGFAMHNFQATAAAIVHQTHGDPFPRMIWATNYNRLACATMFTLFFAGNSLAPKTLIEGEPVQDYLQRHYFGAIQQVALRLKDMPHVVGYDTLNEPSRGYIGFPDLTGVHYRLRNGLTPTPYQAMLLGWGFTQTLQEWDLGIRGNHISGEITVSPDGVRAWQDGRECVWRSNGVWDIDATGTPHLLRSDHFATTNFAEDCLRPFLNAYASAIRAVDPKAIIFIEGDQLAETKTHNHTAEDATSIVYTPHWYDGLTLLSKRYIPFIAFDVHTLKMVLGHSQVRQSFAHQLGVFKINAERDLGGVPTVIGEVGIPFDMNGGAAFRTGNWSAQEAAMDASLNALDANLLSYTLWCYTSDNGNARGDGWNGEDLSIFSLDQQTDPIDIHSGGRALRTVVRPYAMAIAGTPVRMHYDMTSATFEFVYRHDPAVFEPSEIFVPSYQYPQGYTVEVSDGTWETDSQNQRVLYRHSERDMPHFIRITPAVARPTDNRSTLVRLAAFAVGIWLFWKLIRRR